MKTLTFKIKLDSNNNLSLLLPKLKLKELSKQYQANAYLGIINKRTEQELAKELLDEISILFKDKAKV